MTENYRQQGEATVQIENNCVRVTRWYLNPNEETGWHRHEWDYTVVPMDDGELMIETDDSVSYTTAKRGVSYFRQAGATHNVVNNSADSAYTFLEIEMIMADNV
jgi:quercetin dioxygenase-like cupin family protein